jgi:thiamine kinase-like enzyme
MNHNHGQQLPKVASLSRLWRLLGVGGRTPLEQCVARALGRPVKWIGNSEIVQLKAPQRQRSYFKHRFACKDQSELTVFTKSGIRHPEYLKLLEGFLSTVKVSEFRAPRFFGIIDLGGDVPEYQIPEHQIGVWECVSGRTVPLGDCSKDELRRIVHAIGAINALTEHAIDRVPGIPIGVRSMKPVAADVHVALDDFEERGINVTALRRKAEKFEKIEQSALKRLQAIGNQFFSHMNISGANIFFPPDAEPLVVIDWDSACIGPPGGSLSPFSSLFDNEAQSDIVECYVSFMKSKGLSLEASSVLFVMRAVDVFTKLNWATRRSAPGRLARPLPEDESIKSKIEQRAEVRLRWALNHLHYLE